MKVLMRCSTFCFIGKNQEDEQGFKQRREGAMSQTDNGVKIETAALGFLEASLKSQTQHELPSSNLIPLKYQPLLFSVLLNLII